MECENCNKDVTPNSNGRLADSSGNTVCANGGPHVLPAFTYAKDENSADVYIHNLSSRLEFVKETLAETMVALDEMDNNPGWLDSEPGSGRNPHDESFDEDYVVVDDESDDEPEEPDYPFPKWHDIRYVRVGYYHVDSYDEDANSFAMQDLETCPAEDAQFVVVPVTGYSDYSGGSVERSNFRSLQKYYENDHEGEFPDGDFVTSYGGYDSNELLMRVRRSFDDESQRQRYIELIGTCAALAEQYPLFDEEDESELVREEADNSWDQWLRSDIYHDLTDPDRASPDYRERMWDAVINPEAMEDMLDAIPDDVLKEEFYSAYYQDCNEYPYWETGSSGIYFPGLEEFTIEFAKMLWQKRIEMCLSQIPGQKQLFTDLHYDLIQERVA